MRWVVANWDQVVSLALNHVLLSVLPILLSLVLSIPLGWWAHRRRTARRVLLSGSGILYALPSLPLFVILPVLIGTQILDPLNVVVALTLYGVALMVRSCTEAFDAVDAGVRDSATAIGHSPGQRFRVVDLPLAGPPMLAGLRVVSASTLSLVSVGALIGVPSLGYFFTDGYTRSFLTEIIVGIVGTVVLALLFDALLVLAGRLLMPWVRATDTRREDR
ncbi:osmoprotectant transport system permease protein [Raineyella antarctica]|uniref:Osmoprotectant transport system permease protein n=1 Tax=Raineyella antarctica TaxID=1577474 RepID=A0A1G6GFQ5_9ACTN|nr:ABC transporter permease [Raineyella antarctica]SDB80817.1 osmoprotectant transport system permease protein [Raineyella antarctica]